LKPSFLRNLPRKMTSSRGWPQSSCRTLGIGLI
jgi:hypothetical protein